MRPGTTLDRILFASVRAFRSLAPPLTPTYTGCMSGHDHGHDHARGATEGRMWIVFGLTSTFFVVEVVGGLLFGSLALLSDAAHMFTDMMALAIAIAAMRLSRLPADRKRTFGYHRFEILAAAFNASLLFLVAIYILYEAYERWMAPTPIESLGMLTVAVVGLGINVIGMRLLRGDADKSMNVKGAYLEVWADALGSVAVIVGAVIVYFTGWTRMDPIIAVLIAFWVLPRTWALLKQSVNVLLEGVPEGVDLAAIEGRLLGVPGVRDVHELHVWAIGSGKTSLTAHLVIDSDQTHAQAVLDAAAGRLRSEFNITHTTVQAELDHCVSDGAVCVLYGEAAHVDAHRH
jgi:cobalt-zinc-cadmium efflux system protein